MAQAIVDVSNLRTDNVEDSAKHISTFLKETIQPLTANDPELNRIIENLDAIDEMYDEEDLTDIILDIETWCESNNVGFIPE